MGSANSSKQSSNNSNWADSFSSNNNRSAQGSSSFGQSGVWGAQAPALQQLYGQAAQLANGQGAAGQGASQVASQAQNAWLSQLSPGGNPYFERSVQGAIDSATQGFKRDVLPELDARGVGMGQYGGARDSLARGEAAGVFGQGLSNTVAGMYQNQYTGDQNRAASALQQSGMIQGLQTAPLTTAAGLIGGPTVLQQSGANSWGQSQGSGFTQSNAGGTGGSIGRSAGIGVGGK